MASKEALEILEKSILDTTGTTITQEDCIYCIEKDLEKLDKVWDKVEEVLQDELTSLLREIPYDMLNSVKVRILRKLKEWLEND